MSKPDRQHAHRTSLPPSVRASPPRASFLSATQRVRSPRAFSKWRQTSHPLVLILKLMSTKRSYMLCSWRIKYFGTATGFFRLRGASLQDQYRNFPGRLMQSKSPFQSYGWSVFIATVLWTVCNSLLHWLHTHKIWKRSVEKYKRYGTLSKITHFLSVFCEAGMVQQCTEAESPRGVNRGLARFRRYMSW